MNNLRWCDWLLDWCCHLVFTACTCAVRNCLECQHRYPPRTPSTPHSRSPSIKGPDTENDPIQALIKGAQPSSKVGPSRHRVGVMYKSVYKCKIFNIKIVLVIATIRYITIRPCWRYYWAQLLMHRPFLVCDRGVYIWKLLWGNNDVWPCCYQEPLSGMCLCQIRQGYLPSMNVVETARMKTYISLLSARILGSWVIFSILLFL